MESINQYTSRYNITAADMDNNYRMTPNAVLLYYQDSWARYMSYLHLAAFDVVAQNKIWVITQFTMWSDEGTAFWSEAIEVSVWNSEIGSMRLYADFQIRKSDGSVVAHGYGCWTLLDIPTRRIVPIASLGVTIPECHDLASESHKKVVFPSGGSIMREIEHKVNPINLDFNGHVNNRTYLSIAMQTVGNGFLDEAMIRFLSVKWQHESFLGDTLRCTLYQQGEGTYLHTLTKGDGTCAAQIYTECEARQDRTTSVQSAPRPGSI